jgi:hypothetical protein
MGCHDADAYIRLNPTDMLERQRKKRLVFVGDSLDGNMWESLVCIPVNSIQEKRKVCFMYLGNHKFWTEVSCSFLYWVDMYFATFLLKCS